MPGTGPIDSTGAAPPPRGAAVKGNRLAAADVALVRRTSGGRLAPAYWTPEVLVRVAWAQARAFGIANATERLALVAGGREVIDGWVALVATAHAVDCCPARTSAEFVWRHPELVERAHAVLAALGARSAAGDAG